MKKSSVHALGERIGVNAVEEVFLKELGWIFREQPHTDWGVDAFVEVTEGGVPNGKLIALQIKSGVSYFKKRKEGYAYRGSLRHLSYWTNHSLPVFIVMHNPVSGEIVFEKVERRLCKVTKKGWSMNIPADNILTRYAGPFLEEGIGTDEESLRRFRFAADIKLMREIAERPTYFVWEDWVNKGLGIRGLAIYFDDYEKDKADLGYGYLVPTHDVHLMMRRLYPWLTYTYARHIEDCSGEVEAHTLEVELRPVAKAYLEVEKFFHDGPSEEKVPEPPIDEDDEDAIRREATRQDWEEFMADTADGDGDFGSDF